MEICVHGFNIKDPQETVGKLTPYLDDPYIFDYGWFGLFSVLLYNKREAKKLNDIIAFNSVDAVYAHSNGAAIAVESARRGAKIKTLVCINPALKVDTVFPDSIEKIIVVYTKHDMPTRVASFFDKVPLICLLVPNAWGKMGAKGPSIEDDRIIKLDFTNELREHSDFFEEDNLDLLMPRIKKIV
jgi:hypothetical protein